MTTQFELLTTTTNGHKVFARSFPKGFIKLYIKWNGEGLEMGTDARCYPDETYEDFVFMVSSSTGLRREEDHALVAKSVVDYFSK